MTPREFVGWAARFSHQVFMTGDDNTPCAVRIFGVIFAIISTGIFFWLSIHTVYSLRTPLDYAGFGGGLAAVWGVVGGAIAFKSYTERRK